MTGNPLYTRMKNVQKFDRRKAGILVECAGNYSIQQKTKNTGDSQKIPKFD
jgi:hypothetical protein